MILGVAHCSRISRKQKTGALICLPTQVKFFLYKRVMLMQAVCSGACWFSMHYSSCRWVSLPCADSSSSGGKVVQLSDSSTDICPEHAGAPANEQGAAGSSDAEGSELDGFIVKDDPAEAAAGCAHAPAGVAPYFGL